ncbi:MAG: BREX system P-loop protein BrxC [Candidatus Scalindua sp.]
MRLNEIFKKPVDRHIEGVIKADDEASLRLEIEEYVLTNEIAKRLESFLDAYNNYEGANGVWVSGFFGSGKSHLIKMLALVLEDREVDGTSALEMFLSKLELKDNEILRGDLKRAVSIPSKSILFNIDQKADIISKTQVDALLSVFVKVFDEMCGYYGKQGHIAQFERELEEEDLLQKYKKEFNNITGKDWEFGRKRSQRFLTAIDQAYGCVTKQNVTDIIEKYKANYKVSIEDFAEKVQTYIDCQGSNFRLNFFVDEVGQYIADNVKLMTNLQTIAESLATKCRGRAWIVVTAQEDMKTVVGGMGKQQGNDFSKIQDRFATRMKLTSADVAEVIQKRLLAKNESGIEQLSDVYHAQVNNFKTLLDFADGAQTYRNFNDRDHFINCYPFIPYQFTLFQSGIQNLSEHNAFEGKHSSVGERSMLGVFQQVAIQIYEHEIGQLATFDLMFEGIRTALKSQIQRAIQVAEKNLDNKFAVRVLKSLFLVKYIKEFKATVRNLCVLMLDGFDRDIPSLRSDVEEALNLLEQQTYIQRNGDQYEFLTDEEKDIEQEIKNTEVESADVADELSKIVFDHIIKNRKIRYEENGQDYSYSRKLDDKLFGREHELAIHVISPFHENCGKEDIFRMQSMGRDELLVIMPPDDRIVRDILMYKRTEKYIRQNISITQQDSAKKILTDKSFQNQERYGEIRQRVLMLIGKAKLIISGGDFEVGTEDPESKIVSGFYELLLRSYPNLRMLRGIKYTENDIKTCLQQAGEGLFGNDGMMLSESEQEMLAFIQSNNRGGIRTTLKILVEKFEKKPYGWYFAAILCILSKICARGKIEVRSDGNILEDADIERALRNTHTQHNVVLEPQVDFTASQVRQLKEFYEDFFDGPPQANEAKALGKETGAAFEELVLFLNTQLVQVVQYPFLAALEQPMQTIKELTRKPYAFYLTELGKEKDSLLDLKESTLDPIRRFMSGSMKSLYSEARKFIHTQEPNFAYIEGDEVLQIEAILSDPACFKENRMQQAKSLMDSLDSKIAGYLKQEKLEAKRRIDSMKERMEGMGEFAKLSINQQSQLLKPFDQFLQTLECQTLFAVIRDMLRRFEESDYQRILGQMCELGQPKPDGASGAEGKGAATAGKTEPKVEYIALRSINLDFDKAWLADEADVDRYLASLKEKILKEIKNGKRIQI